MPKPIVFAPGRYRYIPAVFQYSAGVAAEEGFELVRVRFGKPLPMADASAAVEAHLKAVGRPTTAFAVANCALPSLLPTGASSTSTGTTWPRSSAGG